MNVRLLFGTAVMVLVTLWLTVVHLSASRAVVFCAPAFLISWGVEAVGTRSTFPFGCQYSYHPALLPLLPGNVPLFIPVAWWIFGSTPLILLRDVTSDERGDASRPRRWLLKASLGGLFLAGCDLVLDPLATSVEAWAWVCAGGFYGTPYLNYVGWFVVGTAIYLGYFSVRGIREQPARVTGQAFDLIWTAANLAFLVLLGVTSCNRLGSSVPALLSFAVTGPFWARWLTLLRGRDSRLASTTAIRRASTDVIS